MAEGNKPCSSLFTLGYYHQLRTDCAQLERKDLDMVILGQIMAGIHDSATTFRKENRTRSVVSFHHKGHTICGTTFRMLHGIGKAIVYMYIV